MSLTDLLLHHTERFPDRLALEFQGVEMSWGDLLEGARATAGALAAAGVEPGDTVGVLAHNSSRFLELMHAISHRGAVFMPLNWRLAGPELAYILDHARAKVVVSEPELEPLLEDVRDELECDRLRIDGLSEAGWTSLDELRSGASPQVDAARVEPDDIQRLMYTSGTTSRPKGVMLSYANVAAKNLAHMVEYGVTPHDVNLACGPLYHVGALDLTTTTMMLVGAPTHVLRRFEPGPVLDAIERFEITHVWLAPAMINALVNEPGVEERSLDSMKIIVDGGEKMPLPLIQKVLGTFPNAWFTDAYGLTETVSGITYLDKGNSLDKIGSVGKPTVHSELRLVDANDREVATGEPGEICIRSPQVCKGYWRDEQATATAMRGGWFHTGDMGVLDEDGFLFIVDRVKDMILSGGENVASSEVERVLYEHSGVLEVAVVGSPDERWGEVPVAYVVLTDDDGASEAELLDHCGRNLARFKVPRTVTFIEELPRNPTGKVLKRELRDREHARGTAAG